MLCITCPPIWCRVLDPEQNSVTEARVLPIRTCKADSETTETHLQSSCPHGSPVALCQSSYPHNQIGLKINRNDTSLSSRVFRSLVATDVESLHLVRQC